MKKLLFITVIVLLANMLPAQIFIDSQYGFSILVPEGWRKSSSQRLDVKLFEFKSPNKAIWVQVRAMHTSPTKPIDSLIYFFEKNQIEKPYLRKSLKNHKTKTGIEGKKGVYYITKKEKKTGVSSFFTIQKENSYIVTAYIDTEYITKANKNKWKKMLKEVSDSFTLLE